MWFVVGASPCQIGPEILGRDLADLDVADAVQPQLQGAIVTVERRWAEGFRCLAEGAGSR